MSQLSRSNSRVQQHRAAIAGVLLFLSGVAGLLQPAAYGGSQGRPGSAPELLGASKKSVVSILGDGQPLVGGLFNEESSASHSGGIGSTGAYRTRIGYLRERSCYAFFMKKTGEMFNPVEVFGLLYLCANRAEWREHEVESYNGNSDRLLIYRETDPKGKAAGQTYLATLDDSACRLFVYSPEWRPDFNRELWINPDEAPVHREAEPAPAVGLIGGIGKQARQSTNKATEYPSPIEHLSGKSGSVPAPSPIVPDAKQGIYLPKLNQVVPADPGEDPKAAKKSGKRKKRRQQEAKPVELGK